MRSGDVTGKSLRGLWPLLAARSTDCLTALSVQLGEDIVRLDA